MFLPTDVEGFRPINGGLKDALKAALTAVKSSGFDSAQAVVAGQDGAYQIAPIGQQYEDGTFGPIAIDGPNAPAGTVSVTGDRWNPVLQAIVGRNTTINFTDSELPSFKPFLSRMDVVQGTTGLTMPSETPDAGQSDDAAGQSDESGATTPAPPATDEPTDEPTDGTTDTGSSGDGWSIPGAVTPHASARAFPTR